MSGANLLSWFALGLLGGAATLTVVPFIGAVLAFLVVMSALLAALLAHAVAEDQKDRWAIVRVTAAYIIVAGAASAIGLWWMGILLAAGAAATAWQAQRWTLTHPRPTSSSIV